MDFILGRGVADFAAMGSMTFSNVFTLAANVTALLAIGAVALIVRRTSSV
jgi:hypothetical protein